MVSFAYIYKKLHFYIISLCVGHNDVIFTVHLIVNSLTLSFVWIFHDHHLAFLAAALLFTVFLLGVAGGGWVK